MGAPFPPPPPPTQLFISNQSPFKKIQLKNLVSTWKNSILIFFVFIIFFHFINTDLISRQFGFSTSHSCSSINNIVTIQNPCILNVLRPIQNCKNIPESEWKEIPLSKYTLSPGPVCFLVFNITCPSGWEIEQVHILYTQNESSPDFPAPQSPHDLNPKYFQFHSILKNGYSFAVNNPWAIVQYSVKYSVNKDIQQGPMQFLYGQPSEWYFSSSASQLPPWVSNLIPELPELTPKNCPVSGETIFKIQRELFLDQEHNVLVLHPQLYYGRYQLLYNKIVLLCNIKHLTPFSENSKLLALYRSLFPKTSTLKTQLVQKTLYSPDSSISLPYKAVKKPNVAIIYLDSVSQKRFSQYLPQLENFLKSQTNFLSYHFPFNNVVGQNSISNQFSLFTGCAVARNSNISSSLNQLDPLVVTDPLLKANLHRNNGFDTSDGVVFDSKIVKTLQQNYQDVGTICLSLTNQTDNLFLYRNKLLQKDPLAVHSIDIICDKKREWGIDQTCSIPEKSLDLFHLFQKYGYKTAIAEEICTFRSPWTTLRLLPEDKKYSADYFHTAFLCGLSKYIDPRHYCINSKPMHSYTLNRMLDMYDNYPNTPLFQYIDLQIGHTSRSDRLGLADADLTHVIQQLIQLKTLIILSSDHGDTVSNLQSNKVDLEEFSRPPLYILIPHGIISDKSQLDMISVNQHRPVTAYDLYWSLWYMLEKDKTKKPRWAYSLFHDPLPHFLDCTERKIPPNFCLRN